MRGFFNILCFIFAMVLGLNTLAYNTLPASRFLTFDDYDDAVWTHSSEVPGRRDKNLKTGIYHEHADGWYVSQGRTGSADYQGFVVPPMASANYAANLQNVDGAYIESPYYDEGVGAIYFDAVNNDSTALSFSVLIATNMNYNGGFSGLLPEEDASHTYNWILVDSVNLNYSTDGQFLRYVNNLNYSGPLKFKIVRDGAVPGFSTDDQFVVIDNIQVSYPVTYVSMIEQSSGVSPAPDMQSGNVNLHCRVDQYYYSPEQPDFNNTDVTVYYRIAPEDGGTFGSELSAVLSYVAGTGDGNGVGREYQGSIPVSKEGAIEYYYVCTFDGHFVPQDYTGTGSNYPYTSESLSPVNLYSDGLGGSVPFEDSWSFGSVPPVTDLPDSRILTFDDYDDLTKWTHSSEDPGRKNKSLKLGITHEHTAGWKISETRTGYSGYKGLIVPPLTVDNYAANMRNIEGACIESPYYTNGVGTLYFEAVNGASPAVLRVSIALNMIEDYVEVPLLPEESEDRVYNWVEVDLIDLNYSTAGDFYRYFKKFNLRRPVKFKFERVGTVDNFDADDQFLVVDNIRVSPPPADVIISKSEVVNNPGYPNADNEFTVRCIVGNMDLNVPTEMRSVYLVSRWRYLDQQIDEWTTNLMTYVEGTGDANGDGEIYEGTVPAVGQEGDLEYYFVCFFGGYYYESPDYTGTGFEYPYQSENLSPALLRSTDPVAGEFAIRLRPYDSRYDTVYVVTDQHEEPIAMDLVGDHEWRGLVPLAGITPTNLTWSFMADKEYVDGSTSFETNILYWSTATSSGSRTPTLPYGGVGVATNQSSRIEISVTDSGYMEVNFNTDTLVFLANRAEYQNFNAWPAREDYFSESSGQSDKKSYVNDFDQWLANEDEIFVEPFSGYLPTTNVYVRDPFPTPGDWVAGSAAYVVERPFDTVYNPAGFVNFRNQALRLKGGDPVLGLGYVYNQVATLPDGLNTLKFKARIGQESDNYSIAYNANSFTDYNYVFRANVGVGNGSPQEPSVSVVAYYTNPGSFYEFRVTQVTDTRGTVNNPVDKRQKLNIIKWENEIPEIIGEKFVNGYSLGSASVLIQIGVHNTSASSVVIRGQFGSGAASVISVTDSSSPLTSGTFGVLCSECDAGFSSFAKGTSGVDGNSSVTPGSVPAPADWFMPLGVFEYRTDVSPNGIYKIIPDQKLNIYVQPTEYGSGDDPAAPGTLDWVLLSQKTVASFGYDEITVDFQSWQSMFVMLQVGDGESDIAVDELEVTSWHGKDIGLGQWDNDEWLATEAWVVSNEVDDVDHVVQLDLTRADPDVDQAVRSLILNNGMGMMEFDYRVLTAPAKLTVQWNNPRDNEWHDIDSFVVTNEAWAHASAYLGTNAPGFLRVLNDRRGGYSNSLVELDKVVVWDEPYVDENSWKSYNTKVSSTDPMRLLLDESKGCYLNNDVNDETNPSPLDRDLPNLQSPILVNGLGKLSFLARAYDAGSPATVYVYASTNGWDLAREYWVLIHQFDNIENEYFKPYSYKPVDGSQYDAIRIETSLDPGEKRACIEEVVISEPVYPGFDIVDVDLLLTERDGSFGSRKQPLAFEDVNVEARVINKQLSPSNIVMYVSYYVGKDVWGVDNWNSPIVTKRMHEVDGEPGLYRTRDDEGDVPGLPESQIGGILGQEDGEVVQYRVWASYLGGIPLKEYQEEFENPSWYYPVDLNEERADEGWSPYYIVYGVPPSTVWINEINVSDLIYGDDFVVQHGIWENAYIEIAAPAWLDLGGWQIDLVTQGDYVSHSITIPSGLPAQNPVTNGYAFFVIADTVSPYPDETPELPKVDFGYAGLRWNMPSRTPGGIRLRRPGGMYEQTIAYDDASRNMSGPYYDGKIWADADPEGKFVYVGEEFNEGSLSRIGVGDTTNSWVYPLLPEYGQDHENFAQNYTPGLPNGLQPLPDAEDLFPGVSNAMINSSISQLRGYQNDKRVLDYSLRMRIGTSTNVTYDVDDWYRLVSLTSNGVEQLPPDSKLTEYTYDLNEISADVDLYATINIREDLTEYQGDSSVINWILGYPEAPLVPMFYNGRELTLDEQFWLDANPTISNEFNCVIRDFTFDGETNLHVRLEMKLNDNNLTNIQGGAVLKLEARQDLSEDDIGGPVQPGGWSLIQQFYLTADSFDSNNECRVFVENPYEFILTTYDMKTFFMRWVIENQDPRVNIYDLENVEP